MAALAMAAVAGAAAVMLAPPVAQAGPSLEIGAGFLSVGLSETGRVTSLVDVRSGFDYVAAGKSVPLVSVVADGQQAVPTDVEFSPRDKVLTFRTDKATVKVKVVNYPTYSTLEVVGLDPAPGADVQTLLWGPVPTKVTQTVGESVGVVRNNNFAFGLRPLNDKTVGSWPNEYLAYGFGPDINSNPYSLQVAPHVEYSAAEKTTWGSILRAYTYDYSRARTRQRDTGFEIPVGPLAGPEGRIVGSKVALFGSAPDLALSVLSEIAQGQGLPYPTINGQWQKATQDSSQSFLVLNDLNTGNFDAAVTFAKQAGLGTVYALGGNGPWKSHGHYQFNSSFGGSDEAATKLVAKAAAEGVEVGVHTLSDFIDAHDPYVQPAPADKRLAVGVSVKLTRPLGQDDTKLYVDAERPLGGGAGYGKRLRIGDEFITYGAVTKVSDTEWEVSGLKRAEWGSAAKSYPAGTSAAQVIVNQYGGGTGDLPIIDEIATRLATAFNTTGITSMSYDGLESASESGWGPHGFARLVNGVYRQLDAKDGFITEASRLSSNTWDAQSRVSWGEIGSTSYGQVVKNNVFYRANFMPPMMGWLRLNGNASQLSIESTMAHAAALDAGIGFQTNVSNLASGSNTATVLEMVRMWESARTSGAFTAEQKKVMVDADTYWHLEEVTPGQEWSLQQLDAAGKPVGEPQAAKAPTPGFATPAPPTAQIGKLYEFKATSSTPKTIRYEITSGALPDGLTLKKDTGAITGIPTRLGGTEFTITARNGGTIPDASITYPLTVAPVPVPPQVVLTVNADRDVVVRGESVDVSVSVRNDGPHPLSGVLSLAGPDKVRVDPDTAEFSDLKPGEAVVRSFKVNVRSDIAAGQVVLTASAQVTGKPVAPVQVSLTVPRENFALGKPTQQSTTAYEGVSSRAVDGNTDGAWGSGSVTHTDYQSQPWWEVDLGSSRSIGEVAVWNRTDCCAARLTDFYVLVSESPFTSGSLETTLQQPGVHAFRHTGTAGSPSRIDVGASGRYVRVQLTSTNNTPLSLAEVQVLEPLG
ncbi:discoidin domain-containing protein [Micromonospora sp. DR5-3]|uniref:galactose-binding domain-containing protein n=1 Tax=unclassified Micromonospora TaxID=2617518 RepID=UPI0011D4DDB2|nr:MULTISPECIES: discoidin domain-containing protein [unclassified Micromonospora]MCW3816023.1 discoidin domain-containing protein [Micromonospora sp. DR5-3]TYC21294.1 hypothetical protein FXF52_26890 [Micromonospora sp. MP36]